MWNVGERQRIWLNGQWKCEERKAKTFTHRRWVGNHRRKMSSGRLVQWARCQDRTLQSHQNAHQFTGIVKIKRKVILIELSWCTVSKEVGSFAFPWLKYQWQGLENRPNERYNSELPRVFLANFSNVNLFFYGFFKETRESRSRLARRAICPLFKNR